MSYRFRPAARPEDRGAQPPRYRRAAVDGMIVERDVAVPVRGGITVYADVFRPADERPAPPLIAWSPYGKHAEGQLSLRYPDSGVAPGQLSAYTAFESPDPVYWTARGYAVVNADIPGTKFVVGGGPMLAALVKRYPEVRFAGPREGEELAAYFAAADVFVFPSRTDTFGLVMLEALASGVPVAAYPVSGPLDVVGGTDVGVLDEDLGSAIRRALEIDPASCRILRQLNRI